MMKKTLKMLSFLAIASVLGSGYGYAQAAEPEGCCPGANFAARGCETQCVSVGGYLSANYQYAHLRDHVNSGPSNSRQCPDHLSNFYMKAIRLFVRGELCNGWSGLMSIDFAGRDHTAIHWTPSGSTTGVSSNESHGRNPLFIDRAYIQKEFCDSVLRVGYQKVNFGAEYLVPDECLKTIKYSIATNYFIRLGNKASVGNIDSFTANVTVTGADTVNVTVTGFNAGNFTHGGNHFAGRHAGLFYSGDIGNFHYHAEIVNGYSGLRHHSARHANELGYFVGAAMDYELCGVDLLFGIHAGFQPQGSRKHHIQDSRNNHRRHVWGFDPYILANWNCFSFLGEFLWGHIGSGSLTRTNHSANPWGVNIVPSYMINDCWELVARFSYVNSRNNGISPECAFGALLEDSTFLGSNSSVRSEEPFKKAASVAVGVNFFPIQSVKASLFYEYTRFKDHFYSDSTGTREFRHGHINVNAIAAQLQLVF